MTRPVDLLPQEGTATQARRRYTYAELLAERPENSQPFELWDGDLVMSPAPSFYHQEVLLRFYRCLHDWVAPRNLGKVVTAPVDMVLSAHRVTQPDVAFIAKDRLHLIEHAIMGPADLLAEVISLGSHTRDRIEKRDLYEQYGVREYWIIDPESESVDVLHLENGTYRLVQRAGPGQVAHSRFLPGFTVDIRQLFHGE